jgi:MEMO1 family protein
MNLIETLNPESFTEYLRKYQNTVCGRHPISVFMQSIAALARQNYEMSFKFLRYAQSNHVTSQSDSSVSYASGSLILN